MIKYNYKNWAQMFKYNSYWMLAHLYYRQNEGSVNWKKSPYTYPPAYIRGLFCRPIPVGNSYLLNPIGLASSDANEDDKALYLYLASMRSLWDYKRHGVITLPEVAVLQDHQLVSARLSNILSVKDGNIHFYYEDS